MNEETLDALNINLRQINETISLGKLGLVKSEELHRIKSQVEDMLVAMKPTLDKIQTLQVDKIIPIIRNTPKTGIFLDPGQVEKSLAPLHAFLPELIQSQGGSEEVEPVTMSDLAITGNTINKAIEDAKVLLETRGATSAVDRMHTVLHGYLKEVCNKAQITNPSDPTLNQLLKCLKLNHPAFSVRNQNVEHILNGLANIMDKLNPVRNSSSLAHSNVVLLEPEEAMLVINTINTLLAYLNSKFSK